MNIIPKSHYRQVRGHALCIAAFVLPYLRYDWSSGLWIERLYAGTWQPVDDQNGIVAELLELWVGRGIVDMSYAEVLRHPDAMADLAQHLKAKLSSPYPTVRLTELNEGGSNDQW